MATWTPTIPAGGSAIIPNFATVQGNNKQAKNTMTNLVSLPSNSLHCLTAPRAVIELVKPTAGRFAMLLAVYLPGQTKQGDRFTVRLQQRNERGIVGGASVVVVAG